MGTAVGHDDYHPAADRNGDCVIGMPDLVEDSSDDTADL